MGSNQTHNEQTKKGDRVVRTTMATLYITIIILLLLSLIKCQGDKDDTAGKVDDPIEEPVEEPIEEPVEEPEEPREGSYDSVDMVLCIDATGSMSSILNTVTTHAVGFCDDLKQRCEENDKHINNFRVRVLAFRDFRDNPLTAFQDSGFFNLPEQDTDFKRFMAAIPAMDGGDTPENGLEALGLAMCSNWTTEGQSRCRVIMLWTDAVPHPISGIPIGSVSMPYNLDGLQQWWETEKMGGGAKRLVLFAPDNNEWRTIHENWSDVTHSTDYTNPEDYENIINKIVAAL